MKNTIKLFGIIALVAVIGFAMTACKTGDGEDAGTPYTMYKGSGFNTTSSRLENYGLKITGDNKYKLGRVHTTEKDTNAGQPNKRGKHNVAFVIPGSNTPVCF